MNPSHELWNLLDSRKLRTFVMLAKTGSFTLAGREVGISQSGVSHCIRSLESDMGCRLFDRLGKKVHATPAGEQLLHHAECILAEMAHARDSIQKLNKWGQGRLRLAASPAACQYILPDLCASLKRGFPQMLISIEACNSTRIVQLLEERGADMALSLRPEAPNSCHFEPLFQDELHFIMAPNHVWMSKAQVPRDTLGDEPFVSYSRNSQTFRMIENYFRREEISLNLVAELGSMDAIKEFVTRGLGFTVMALWVAKRELDERNLVSLPLGRRRLRREWGLLWLQDRRMNLAEETFLQLCRERTTRFATCDPE